MEIDLKKLLTYSKISKIIIVILVLLVFIVVSLQIVNSNKAKNEYMQSVQIYNNYIKTENVVRDYQEFATVQSNLQTYIMYQNAFDYENVYKCLSLDFTKYGSMTKDKLKEIIPQKFNPTKTINIKKLYKITENKYYCQVDLIDDIFEEMYDGPIPMKTIATAYIIVIDEKINKFYIDMDYNIANM